MNWLKRLHSVILHIVIVLSELSDAIVIYETHFMDSYCSSVGTGKSQSGSQTSGAIQLGKDSCNSVALLRSYRTEFPNNAKCEVNVKAPSGYGIMAVLKYASFRPFLPCDHERDELIISLNKSVHFNISSSDGQDFVTDSNDNDIAIKFVTSNMRDAVDGKGFEIIFTAYRAYDGSDGCGDDLFDCDNSRCVHIGLKCNQVNNCGNNKDEIGCDYGVSSVWLLLAISGWLFSGFNVIGIFLWISYQKYYDNNYLR